MRPAEPGYWALLGLLCTCGSCVAPPSEALPRGYQDALLCPPGRCRYVAKKLVAEGHKQYCSSGRAALPKEAILPRGLGESLTKNAWTELTEAGWHNVTCLEVRHSGCAYHSGTPEWAVCRVVAAFLTKTLGELNLGLKKTVPKVRGALAPYLAGAEAAKSARLKKAVETLWRSVESPAAELYRSLGLDSVALANAILKSLKQDGFGTLEAEHEAGGKPAPPGAVTQQALFDILAAHDWKSRFALHVGWSVYAWQLVICVVAAALALLLGMTALCRSMFLKKARERDA